MAKRQQFIFNDKTVGITTILFRNQSPILNIDKIVFFKETGLNGNWIKKEFKYSFDNIVWSSMRTLTQYNVSSIDFTNHPNFYMEILYTRANYNTAHINDFYLFYDSNNGTPVDPSVGPINADTLQGEPGSFYLDRANHTGPLSDLGVYNVTDGSGAGVYSHREDSSNGTNIYFKRIEGKGGVQVSDNSLGTIIIDASGISAGNTYINELSTAIGVGGIIQDSSFFYTPGKTFEETMEAMFYPTLYPTLTNPNNSFVIQSGANSLEEINDALTVVFYSSLNRGSISPAYGTNGFRSGDSSVFHYTGVDLPLSDRDDSGGNTQQIGPYTVLIGMQAGWTSAISYNEGDQPLDSIGNPYDTSLAAGTTSYKSVNFEGVYPIYATTVNIDVYTKQILYSMLNANNIVIPMRPESGGYKQSFDIANAWIGLPTDRRVRGIETFNTFAQIWEYQGGTENTSMTYWTETITNYSGVPYTRYTYNGIDRSSIQIRLKF